MIHKLIAGIKYYLKKKKLDLVHMSAGSGTIFLPYGPSLKNAIPLENRNYVKIGNNCIINADFIFESKNGYIEIGNNVQIGSAKIISINKVVIGNDVTMAWDITIYDHNSHSIYWDERSRDNENCYLGYVNSGNMLVNKDWSNVISKPIHIKNKVWVGFGVIILKGVTIGEGAVIAACSVVTKDVLPWTVVAGNPAVIIKKVR